MFANTYHLTADSSNNIICFYANNTNQLQIAKITNVPNFQFERVIFPGERLLFEALPIAKLEIYVGKGNKITLVENLVCEQLKINQESSIFELESSSNLVSRMA